MAAASDQMSSPERGSSEDFFQLCGRRGKRHMQCWMLPIWKKRHGTDVAVGYIKPKCSSSDPGPAEWSETASASPFQT